MVGASRTLRAVSRGDRMRDTPPDVEARYRQMLLARPGEDRLRMGFSMYATARAMVVASILAREPDASAERIREAIFLRFYGRDFDEATRDRIASRLGQRSGRADMGTRTLHPETTAEAYLELLKDRGIDVFLGNAGTDFASLVEAFAHFEAEGGRAPRPLVVPHEFVAVSMAHGYYAASGKPAAVMVHVNVGTGNASTAIITAARANVPIFMSAGRTPVTEEGLPGSRDLHIHWAQESFDQAAMLREYVKWDYELRTPVQLEAVVDRALELMHAEPRGPVYLTLPREVLAARPGTM